MCGRPSERVQGLSIWSVVVGVVAGCCCGLWRKFGVVRMMALLTAGRGFHIAQEGVLLVVDISRSLSFVEAS